jgi:AcrR family transcriptional regulator/GNAT superfamily N-acetyltransferase
MGSHMTDKDDKDDEVRARILDAAAVLFAAHGYSGTKVDMVAKASGVSSSTVRRLTGGRAELFEQVLTARVSSSTAERVAAAVDDPSAVPPLAVMMAAAQEVYANPGSSWDILELEALTRAHLDERIDEIETARIAARRENAAALVGQIRSGGGLDVDVSDNAVVLLSVALSVGLAMLDPVFDNKPSMAQWNALIARVGSALMPQDLQLAADYEAGKPWRVRVDVPERPGALARLVRSLSSLHAYTVSVSVVGHEEGYRTIDVALIAPHSVSKDVLRATALAAGRRAYVGHGSPDDDLDLPTRLLDDAAILVESPQWAPVAAATLVEADSVEVIDATEGADDAPDVLRLQWTPDQHVVLRRSWAPFAGAERTRASALLRLSAAIDELAGHGEADGQETPIKDGTVWIRLARPGDSEAVADMHERCSERSRFQRYFSVTDWHGVKLHRLVGGHRGATLVVINEAGDVIGLGNVFPDASEGADVAEIAMIVEDAYHGRGVGRKLLASMLQIARRLGFVGVTASVLADNNAMLGLLSQGSDLEWETKIHDGVASMRAPLREVTEVSLPRLNW